MTSSEKGEAGQDDLAPEPQGVQHEHEPARTTGNGNAMLHMQAFGNRRFQTGNQFGICDDAIAVSRLIF